MNFLDRIVGVEETRAASGLADPAAWLVDALGGLKTFSGKRVSLEDALAVTSFRAGVYLISETVGLLPFKAYRMDADGNKFEARQHRMWRILNERPNPDTSAHRFWSTAAAHLRIHGNVFIEKLRGPDGLVAELWLRDPRNVVVKWDDSLKRKIFEEQTTYGTLRWDNERMLHIAGWSTNGLVGDSLLWHGRQTLGNAIAREEFEGSFYKRGAVLAYVIQHPGRLGDAGAKRLRDYFAKWYGGTAQAGKSPVLEEGAEVKTVGSVLKDLQFEEAQTRTRTEVAVLLNAPPAFLGGSTGDSLTYATVEANMVQFIQHAISPLTSTIQEAVSADPSLFPWPSQFAEFSLDGMLRGDSSSRANFYKIMSEIGALTVNEIRAMENREPLAEEPVAEEPAPPEDPSQDPAAEDVPGAPVEA